MVRYLIERIAAPVRGLHQAAYLLAILTFGSQALALMRDRVFAHTFGAGHVLDLYYASFRVPDLVFALISSLVSAYVLIPLVAREDKEKARIALSESVTFLLFGGAIICAVLAIFMPTILRVLYPDLSSSPLRADFIDLSRLLLVQPIILGLSGIFGSVVQVHRRFVLFALSPILYNLGIIIGAWWLYPAFGLLGIGMGVVVGAIAHLLVSVPVIRSAKLWPRFAIPSASTFFEIVHHSIPRSLALGMGSVTALVLTAFASRVGTGAVSVFTFASNLESVPLALIGSSYAVAAFPALSEATTGNDGETFSRILKASARHLVLWSCVALGLTIVLRAHIVRIVLGSGAFDWAATRLTAALLAILVVGIIAQGLVLLLSRALYAAQQSWRPLIYQIAGGALTVGIAALMLRSPDGVFVQALASILRVDGVPGSAILLVALAATLGQLALLGLSLLAIEKSAPGFAQSLRRPAFEGLVAALIGGACAYGALALAGGIAPLTTLASVMLDGGLGLLAGVCGAALTLYVLKNSEVVVIADTLVRLWKTRTGRAAVLAPSGEEIVQP